MSLRWITRSLLAAIVVAAGALAACGSGRSPGFDLAGLPVAVADHYRFIASHRELAEQIACYCGCGQTLDHRDLSDCFVRDDGSYEPHGAGCGTCLAEATQVEQWSAQGIATSEIAARVDEQFSMSGPPTRKR